MLLPLAALLAETAAASRPAVIAAGVGQGQALRQQWSQSGGAEFAVVPPPGVAKGQREYVSMSAPEDDRSKPFGAGLLADNEVGGRVPVVSYSHWADPSTLPADFDVRTANPTCRTMRAVQNQGACAGCYSFASVASLGDRICHASNGSVDAILSAEDPLFCPNLGGCRGGNLGPVWDYLANVGVPYYACESRIRYVSRW